MKLGRMRFLRRGEIDGRIKMINHEFMDAKPIKTPPDWMLKQLEESEAEIATAAPVTLEPFLEKLQQSIAQMEVTNAAAKSAKAAAKAGSKS